MARFVRSEFLKKNGSDRTELHPNHFYFYAFPIYISVSSRKSAVARPKTKGIVRFTNRNGPPALAIWSEIESRSPERRASRRFVDFLLFKIMRNVRRDVSQRHSASLHPLDSPNSPKRRNKTWKLSILVSRIWQRRLKRGTLIAWCFQIKCWSMWDKKNSSRSRDHFFSTLEA